MLQIWGSDKHTGYKRVGAFVVGASLFVSSVAHAFYLPSHPDSVEWTGNLEPFFLSEHASKYAKVWVKDFWDTEVESSLEATPPFLLPSLSHDADIEKKTHWNNSVFSVIATTLPSTTYFPSAQAEFNPIIVPSETFFSLTPNAQNDPFISPVLKSEYVQQQFNLHYELPHKTTLSELFSSASFIPFKPVSQLPDLFDLAMLGVGILTLLGLLRRKRIKQRLNPFHS